MHEILHGFTMLINGKDFGYDTGTVSLPFPTAKMQEYTPGSVDLAENMAMGALEPIEITVKMESFKADIMAFIGQGPNVRDRFQFRAGVYNEERGDYDAHLCIAEGSAHGASRDEWKRGEKAGIELKIVSVRYYKYAIEDRNIHEVRKRPPRRIVNGVDQLAGLNAAMGI